MTALASPASRQSPGRYRFRHLARMEWIKLRSLRSTWLTLALAVCAPPGAALATGGSNTTSGGTFVSYALTGMLIGVLLMGVAGVLAMTGEYASGTISATFAAAPRRAGSGSWRPRPRSSARWRWSPARQRHSCPSSRAA